jgi:hypothetical protein
MLKSYATSFFNFRNFNWLLLSWIVVCALVRRIILFLTEYNRHFVNSEYFSKVDSMCIQSEAVRDIFHGSCALAKKHIDAKESRFLSALQVVLDQTHSCIEIPCVDLLNVILNSWASIILISGILIMYGRWIFNAYKNHRLQKATAKEAAEKLFTETIDMKKLVLQTEDGDDDGEYVNKKKN